MQRMPVSHDEILKALNEYFAKKFKYINNIFAGHEWRELTGRCHYQCVIEFDKVYRLTSEIATLFEGEKSV